MSFVNGKKIQVRTFGWIQDPGNFRNLKNVVGVFCEESEIHKRLKNKIIPSIVEERDGRDRFIEKLSNRPLSLNYRDLVGTSFTPRSSARCNGIIQAVLPGQRRLFQGDWPANNFLRWAHALGFISYSYENDTFQLTDFGKKYALCVNESEEESKILEEAMLSYPPVMRVLNLLSQGQHMTKFEIGSKLGFIGEDGFTTLPQQVLLESLAEIDDPKEKNKMLSDWDGSSDKYARMICAWLISLGWVKQEKKDFFINKGTDLKIVSIGQAYKITPKGIEVRKRGLGKSSSPKVSKNVCWEFFATKCSDKIYVRTRRSRILQLLMKNSLISLLKLKEGLNKNYGIDVPESTIKDDIEGFVNVGINIESSIHGYRLKDNINEFIVPELTIEESKISDIEKYKVKYREILKCIPHNYLALIDIAFDGEQNRMFEMLTINLLVNECGFEGKHLGGSKRPDGIIYKQEEKSGIIIDNKAYSDGYSLPISQADEMGRYIRENQKRSIELNPNQWWRNFSESIDKFYFAFISSLFKGKYLEQINRISLETGLKGLAINVFDLLVIADKIKSSEITHREFFEIIDKGNIPQFLA